MAQAKGQLIGFEPFVSQQVQQLHVEFSQILCPKQKSVVLFAKVSPQHKSHKIWQEFSQITLKNCR